MEKEIMQGYNINNKSKGRKLVLYAGEKGTDTVTVALWRRNAKSMPCQMMRWSGITVSWDWLQIPEGNNRKQWVFYVQQRKSIHMHILSKFCQCILTNVCMYIRVMGMLCYAANNALRKGPHRDLRIELSIHGTTPHTERS